MQDKCYTDELLYNMYADNCNLAYLSFLKPILTDVQKINKLFESNTADPTKLLNDNFSNRIVYQKNYSTWEKERCVLFKFYRLYR